MFPPRSEVFSACLAAHVTSARASLGLACAQAATLCTQVVGQELSTTNGAPSFSRSLRPHWMQPPHLSSVSFALSACVCSSSDEVTVTSISHPSFVWHRGLCVRRRWYCGTGFLFEEPNPCGREFCLKSLTPPMWHGIFIYEPHPSGAVCGIEVCRRTSVSVSASVSVSVSVSLCSNAQMLIGC